LHQISVDMYWYSKQVLQDEIEYQHDLLFNVNIYEIFNWLVFELTRYSVEREQYPNSMDLQFVQVLKDMLTMLFYSAQTMNLKSEKIVIQIIWKVLNYYYLPGCCSDEDTKLTRKTKQMIFIVMMINSIRLYVLFAQWRFKLDSDFYSWSMKTLLEQAIYYIISFLIDKSTYWVNKPREWK
jgi:hypothetical protein